MTEAEITEAITNWLRTIPNLFWFKVHGHNHGKAGRQKPGIPDLYISYRGVTEWVEIKTEKGKLSPVQVETIDQMKRAGARVSVVKSLEEVKVLLLGVDARS